MVLRNIVSLATLALLSLSLTYPQREAQQLSSPLLPESEISDLSVPFEANRSGSTATEPMMAFRMNSSLLQ